MCDRRPNSHCGPFSMESNTTFCNPLMCLRLSEQREKKAKEEAALQGRIRAHSERLAQLYKRVDHLANEFQQLPSPSSPNQGGSAGAGSSRLPATPGAGSSSQTALPPQPHSSHPSPGPRLPRGTDTLQFDLPPLPPAPRTPPAQQRQRRKPSYWDIELPDDLKEDDPDDSNGRGRR